MLKNSTPSHTYTWHAHWTEWKCNVLGSTSFTQEILTETGETVGSPVVNPWDGKTMHEPGEPLKKKKQESYRNKLGKLLYLTGGTRPDIEFAVGWLATVASCPRDEDWTRLLRVLHYLIGSQHYWIRYRRWARQARLDLYGFVDSSFRVSPTEVKSISASSSNLLVGRWIGVVTFRRQQRVPPTLQSMWPYGKHPRRSWE